MITFNVLVLVKLVLAFIAGYVQTTVETIAEIHGKHAIHVKEVFAVWTAGKGGYVGRYGYKDQPETKEDSRGFV